MSTEVAPLPDTEAGRGRRFALIGSLYATQNLSLGFFTFAFLTIAQARGVPLAVLGAAAGISVLLTLKFLWAPLVDRFGWRAIGHYRGWLLTTQTALAVGIGGLALFDPADDFDTLIGVFAVLFVLAATQDVAADAAATRLLRPSERGFGNGIQSAGASVAQVVGGGVTLLVYQAAGWQAAAIFLAAFSLVPLPFVLAWREREEAHVPAPRIGVRQILRFFADPAVRLWCFVCLPAYTAGFTVAYNLVRPMLVAAGWDEGRIGLVVVIGGSVVGIVAGLAAGILISRIGRRISLVVLGLVQVLATFGTIPLALGFVAEWYVWLVVVVANGAFSAAFAIVYTICMDLTRPESAGTDFTAFTTVVGLLMVVAGVLGISIAGTVGFTPVLVAAGVLAAAGLGVTVLVARRVLPVETRGTTPRVGGSE